MKLYFDTNRRFQIDAIKSIVDMSMEYESQKRLSAVVGNFEREIKRCRKKIYLSKGGIYTKIQMKK